MLSNTLLQLLLSREVVYTYKQQEAGFSRQSYFYFQGFWGSELLNGCLVVWLETYVYEEYSNFQESKSIFMISDFEIFPKMLLRQLNFGVLLV